MLIVLASSVVEHSLSDQNVAGFKPKVRETFLDRLFLHLITCIEVIAKPCNKFKNECWNNKYLL